MKKIVYASSVVLLGLLAVLLQACMHTPDGLPSPIDSAPVSQLRQWFAQATSSPTSQPTWWAQHLQWDQTATITTGGSAAYLVPIGDTGDRFAGTNLAAIRRLLIQTNSLKQREGFIIELYTQPGQLPAESELASIYLTAVQNVHQRQQKNLGRFTGNVVVYTSSYRYVTGLSCKEGQVVGRFRMTVTRHNSLKSSHLQSTMALTAGCNPGLNCDQYCGTVTVGDGGGGGSTYCTEDCYVNPTQPSNPGGDGGGGGIPSDPGNGGWGGTDPTVPAPTPTTTPPANQPCATNDQLVNNWGFISTMMNLQNLTTLPYEVGYTFQDRGYSTNSYTQLQGDPNDASIGFAVHFPIDGYVHTHYTGLLSVFSGSDIQAMYQIYTQGNMINPAYFTAGVITAQGTMYTLQINDLAAFKAFGAQWMNDTNGRFTLFETLYQGRYGISPTNTNEQNEAGFMRLLQDYHTGLNLYKGDPNKPGAGGAWKKLGLDANGNVVATGC